MRPLNTSRRRDLTRLRRGQQASHRELRSAIRVARADGEQRVRAALLRREGLVGERNAAIEKQAESDLEWLTQRLEAARAAAVARDMRTVGGTSGAEERARALEIFTRQLLDMRARYDAIKSQNAQLLAQRAKGE